MDHPGLSSTAATSTSAMDGMREIFDMPTEEVAAIITAIEDPSVAAPDSESELPATVSLDQVPTYIGSSAMEALRIMPGPTDASSSDFTEPPRRTLSLSPARPTRRLWRTSPRTDSPTPLLRRNYPTWKQEVAADDEKLSMSAYNTKPRKLGLFVDTGAYDNIGGSESAWFKEHLADLERLGMKPTIRDIPQIAVSGVGSGAATSSKAFTFPGAVVNGDGIVENMMFDTPIVDGSPIPPLWGLQSLRRHRALIDCEGLRLHLLGAGDLRLSLPPGSRTFPLELSEGGHLILPINEFERLKEQNKTMNVTPKKTLTFAAHPELVEIPPVKKMVDMGTQTETSSGASSQ